MSLELILRIDDLSFLIPLVYDTSFFLTIAALVLFIEAAIVLRILVLGRSRLAHYALLGLPLGASILCYIVAMVGWRAYYGWQNSLSIDTHFTPYLWNDMFVRYNFLSNSIIGLLQCALAVFLFILTLFLEKLLLPRINRRPLWTLVRRPLIV